MKKSLLLVLLLALLAQCFAVAGLAMSDDTPPSSDPNIVQFSITTGGAMSGNIKTLDLTDPANRTVVMRGVAFSGVFQVYGLIFSIPSGVTVTSVAIVKEDGTEALLGLDNWGDDTTQIKELTITCSISPDIEIGTILNFAFAGKSERVCVGKSLVTYSDRLKAGTANRVKEQVAGSSQTVYYANAPFTVEASATAVLPFDMLMLYTYEGQSIDPFNSHIDPYTETVKSATVDYVFNPSATPALIEAEKLFRAEMSVDYVETFLNPSAFSTFYVAYDTEAPVPVLTFDEATCTLTGTAADSFPGIAGYCLSRSETPDKWTDWDGTEPIVKKNVGGVWYLHVKDKCGNIATVSCDCGGWAITVLTDGNGEADPDKTVIVPDGELFSFTVSPKTGYVLDTLTLNGPDHKRAVVQNADGTYTYSFLAMVDTKVVASFCPAPSLDNLDPARNARLTEGDTPSNVEKVYCYGVFDATVTGESVATLGDAIKAACMLRELYYGNTPAFAPDAADPMGVYTKYARAHAIYLDADFKDADFASPVTQDQVAYLLSNILMKDTVEGRSTVAAPAGCDYPDAAALMMQAGILSADADFAANVTMDDLAAILLRAIEPAARL